MYLTAISDNKRTSLSNLEGGGEEGAVGREGGGERVFVIGTD